MDKSGCDQVVIHSDDDDVKWTSMIRQRHMNTFRNKKSSDDLRWFRCPISMKRKISSYRKMMFLRELLLTTTDSTDDTHRSLKRSH